MEPGNTTTLTSSIWDKDCSRFKFGFYSVFIGLLCLCGITGNTLAFLVLEKEKANRVALFLLKSLALADNLVLLISLVVLSLCYGTLPLMVNEVVYANVIAYVIKYVQPLAYVSHTACIWMTVILALNRLVAQT